MIRSFASTDTESFFVTGKSRRFPPEILKRAAMRLTQLNAATDVKDLRATAFEPLRGAFRQPRWAVEHSYQPAVAPLLSV